MKYQIFNDKMIEFGKVSFDRNVPVGFVVSDSGTFLLTFSLSSPRRRFETFESLVDFVNEFKLEK